VTERTPQLWAARYSRLAMKALLDEAFPGGLYGYNVPRDGPFRLHRAVAAAAGRRAPQRSEQKTAAGRWEMLAEYGA